MDTQTMMGLAAGLGWGAAIVQTLRHSAAASRAIRAERERDAIEAEAMQHAHERNESIRARDHAVAETKHLRDAVAVTCGERDRARTELATMTEARDETIAGLRSAIEERGAAIQALRRELGVTLEQRDAATVARDAATAALAERTADRDGADLAHADCERRLAELGERLAAAERAREELQRKVESLQGAWKVEQLSCDRAQKRVETLGAEIESLKASLAAARAAQDAPHAAAAPEAPAAPAIVTKGRRRRA